MASHRSTEQKESPEQKSGYLGWSRDPAVGIFAVLPLWLVYEGLRLSLAPDERNGAEALITDFLGEFGPQAFTLVRIAMMVVILLAAWSIHRRQLPWGRVVMVSVLEGAVYGLMLGPVTAALTLQFVDPVKPLMVNTLVRDLIGSLGAGIFEEALFRLGLLSLLALLLQRACRAISIHALIGTSLAILISALLFSLFHHVGIGAHEFEIHEFTFRAVAGLILGALFVLRGFGVCVYTHAIYDLHFYLTN
ncbi:MAG: CPBP family glutamic-type intramembrane protease [Planctomycetota bacterium]